MSITKLKKETIARIKAIGAADAAAKQLNEAGIEAKAININPNPFTDEQKARIKRAREQLR